MDCFKFSLCRLITPLLFTVLVTACQYVSDEEDNTLTEESAARLFNNIVDTYNECTTDNECMVLYPGCPLGCGAAIHTIHEQAVRDAADELMTRYNQQNQPSCAYICMPIYPICHEGECEARSL